MNQASPAGATVLTSWAKAIKKALDESSCDSASLFRAVGLNMEWLNDPEARYSLAGTTQLWQRAVLATGDPAFGLKVASQVMPATFHVVGLTLSTSATLKGAFERIARYSRIVTDVGWITLEDHGTEFHVLIEIGPDASPPANEAIDAFVSVQVRMSRAWLGRDVSPLRIELRRPPPPDPRSFFAILRAPLHFGARQNRIVFSQDIAGRTLDWANPALAQNYDTIARKYLASFDERTVLAQVRGELIRRLSQGEPSQDDIAAALHLGTRSLQRKLAEHDTTYKQLLDTTRHELALAYLGNANYSVTEATYLLGFSETSSFTRAFRRWTGKSPSEHRIRIDAMDASLLNR